MPELPEVETVRRGLAPVMEGRRLTRVIQRRPDLRWPLPDRFAERLTGRRVERLGRRSKYLLAALDDAGDGEETLILHLGMSGRLLIGGRVLGDYVHDVGAERGEDAPGDAPYQRQEAPILPSGSSRGLTAGSLQAARSAPRDPAVEPRDDEKGRGLAPLASADAPEGKHDHVVFEIETGARVTYNDARRFGAMDLQPTARLHEHRLLASLGPEPLGNAFNGPWLAERLKGRTTSIKAALMDQRTVAGLGNIYVCEALWRARISPLRAAGSLSPERLDALAAAVRETLEDAIAAGGSSLRDYRRADGELGDFQHTFAVYGRAEAPCPREGCKGTVTRVAQAGRSSFYCPACQR